MFNNYLDFWWKKEVLSIYATYIYNLEDGPLLKNRPSWEFGTIYYDTLDTLKWTIITTCTITP